MLYLDYLDQSCSQGEPKLSSVKLLVFDRKSLRSVFGPCRNDSTEEWRHLYNNESLPLWRRKYSESHKIKSAKMSWS